MSETERKHSETAVKLGRNHCETAKEVQSETAETGPYRTVSRFRTRFALHSRRRILRAMPELNRKQEAFLRELIRNHGNGTRAYATVYRCSEEAANASAARLLANDSVRARLAELTRPAEQKTRITAELLIDQLLATVEAAAKDRSHAAIPRCIELIAKLKGMLVDRVEVGGPGAFIGLKTHDEVADAVVREYGSARAALAILEPLRELLLERAGRAAIVIEQGTEIDPRKMPWRADS